MPKDTRKIVTGVILPQKPGRTFEAGQEDHLERVMSPSQCDRLLDTGAIEGDWSAKGKEYKMLDARKDKRQPDEDDDQVELSASEIIPESEDAEENEKTAAGHKQTIPDPDARKKSNKPATHRAAGRHKKKPTQPGGGIA